MIFVKFKYSCHRYEIQMLSASPRAYNLVSVDRLKSSLLDLKRFLIECVYKQK